MEPNPFQGLDIEREKAKRYGRFKALQKDDSEELDEEYTAERVAETIEKELDQRIEDQLTEKGHIPKSKELSPDNFREIHKRMENIENEWEAAFKGKDYSEVEREDVEVLESLLSDFLYSLKHEMKTTDYIDLFHSELGELEVDRNAVETILGLEESNGSKVGKHLENLNRRQRQDLRQVQKKVNQTLQNRQEGFKSQIEQFEEHLEIYRQHLQTLEAVEKELQEIREKTADEDVEKKSEEVEEMTRECMETILDLIERKQDVLNDHTQARKMKKGVNKLFLNGML